MSRKLDISVRQKRLPMIIRIKKLSNDKHELSIHRSDGSSESVTCDTRNFLKHDLLHFAVESEARLTKGFWGLLAKGKSFSDLNDRTGESIAHDSDQIMVIEAVVGVLHNVSEVESIEDLLNSLSAQGKGLGWEMPSWFTEVFVTAVKEKMRQLNGRWRATGFGESMELDWN